MAITINGNTNTISGVAVGGLPDGIVDTDMIAADSVTSPKIGTKTFTSYAIICDQKSADVDAGTFTSGAWRTRDLNTELYDPDGIVSISSNQFILAAGSYLIEWSCPAMRCGRHQSRLYDITGSAVIQLGKSAFTDTGVDGDQTDSVGAARITISANNTYEIQHRCSTTENTMGLGNGADFGGEIYTVVKIYKEA